MAKKVTAEQKVKSWAGQLGVMVIQMFRPKIIRALVKGGMTAEDANRFLDIVISVIAAL